MIDMETLYDTEAAAAAASANKPFVPAVASVLQTPRQSISEHNRAPTSPVKETPREAPKPSPAVDSPREVVRPKSPVRTSTSTFTPPPLKSVNAPAAVVAAAPLTSSFNEQALTDRLEKITALLEKQNLTLATQNEQIRELTKEVDTLKEKIGDSATTVVVGNEELEEESRRKDEIIRKLELELEEARS
jgi:coronin-1B/1C/6